MMYTANVLSRLNNIIITVSDSRGQTLISKSAGHLGFKGSKKCTRNAAQAVGEAVGRSLLQSFPDAGVQVVCQGIGNGKTAGIRGIRSAGVKIVSIEDSTRIAHNGCRLPKRRRV